MSLVRDGGVNQGGPRPPDAEPRVRRDSRLVTRPPTRKRSVSHRAIARRARLILWTKRVLPAVALILLALVVMWPEINRLTAAGQSAVQGMHGNDPLGGDLIDAHYRGVDNRGQPYTVTAASGEQVSPEQVDMVEPKADMTVQSGNWVIVQADRGVYMQHKAQLDLAGHVVMYRDDGIFLRTETATLDLKAGFAAGSQVVSVEGPFGTIDATGFSAADKGTILQFTGPARLVLNERQK
jgi:lipopolysaccharide export system protein LptC